MHAGGWEQFIMLELEEGAAVSPDDAFDYAEWVGDGGASEHPADTAWDAASVLVTRFVAADPNGLGGIHCGGGSPGGNMDAISGPLDRLALLAERIDPERDDILLERDDDLVDQGMSKALYV